MYKHLVSLEALIILSFVSKAISLRVLDQDMGIYFEGKSAHECRSRV